MRIAPSFPALLVLVLAAEAQTIDFEAQPASACQVVFPSPAGTLGDPEGISTNGFAPATCDRDNGCGFPTTGSRYLRLVSNGSNGGIGEVTSPGVPPAALTAANEVYLPVPPAATSLSLSWDFYYQEDFMEPVYNDGMMIDFVDAGGNQLAVIAFADTFVPQGPCNDGIGDPASPPPVPPTACANVDAFGTPFNGVEVDLQGAGAGPETVGGAAVPAGAVYVRVAVWNGNDDSLQCTAVVDSVVFAMPSPTYPGTGEDLVSTIAINGSTPLPVAAGTDVRTLAMLDFVEIAHASPGGSLVGVGEFLAIGTVVGTPSPLPAPFPGIWLDPVTAFIILGGTVGGFPFLLPNAGVGYSFVDSGTLAGFTFGVQAFVITSAAGNAIFASTNALELRL